jgi:putative transposase
LHGIAETWINRLFEARKRYKLRILNYTVTSNHVHLLVLDSGSCATIPKSMQLIAEPTAQLFNQRKGRKGAFREDRYHATAIETDRHLVSSLTYIDLNMVRAEVVAHPSDREFGGHREILFPRERYFIIDHESLMNLSGVHSIEDLRRANGRWVEDALARAEQNRESRWTESIAVGSRGFVEDVQAKLGIRAKGGRIITGIDAEASLREPQTSYRDDFNG